MTKSLEKFYKNNKKIIAYILFGFMIISLTWSISFFMKADKNYKAQLKIKQEKESLK